jgi:predicted nucleic acid-binding protein
MTRVVLDTNVLVSFLTDRHLPQQAQAARFLTRAAAGEIQVILHQTVAMELAYVLRNLYNMSSEEVAPLLRDLLVLPGLVVTDRLPWSTVLDLWPSQVPDLADAILAAVASVDRCDAIATFDRAFRRRMAKLGVKSYW